MVWEQQEVSYFLWLYRSSNIWFLAYIASFQYSWRVGEAVVGCWVWRGLCSIAVPPAFSYITVRRCWFRVIYRLSTDSPCGTDQWCLMVKLINWFLWMCFVFHSIKVRWCFVWKDLQAYNEKWDAILRFPAITGVELSLQCVTRVVTQGQQEQSIHPYLWEILSERHIWSPLHLSTSISLASTSKFTTVLYA